MRKANAFLFCAASVAALFSACGSDNGAGTTPPINMMGSQSQTGDAGAGPVVNQPMDSGAPVAMGTDSGTPVVTPKDSGAPVDTGSPVVAADTGVAPDAGSSDAAVVGGPDPDFDKCYAMVKPSCNAKEMNTAALMETPCKALVNIPLPLTDGTMYGPKTITAGPYGGACEWNEGKGTEFVNPVNLSEDICVPLGIDTFMEPSSVTDEIKNLRDVDWSLYTIFRPACFKKGEKYPVITWANGTCGEIAGYSALLTTIASHGFIVIASNSTWTASSPTDKVQLRALDYAKALNEDSKSIFYQKMDLEHVGASGHSQGAGATGNADGDPRVDTALFWNKGTSNEKPFLNVSGERDIGDIMASGMKMNTDQATQPGAWVYYHKVPVTGGTSTGHLTLMEQPERVIDLAVAWFKWQLKGDMEAKKMFVGDNCGFCNMKDEFDYGHNAKLQ